MKLSTFSAMIKEYEIRPIDSDDLKERERLLAGHDHSVIFEGNILEFENALDWLKNQLNIDKIDYIFYGKLGYDYGFFELFFPNETDATKFEKILPDIFTKFPNGSMMRSAGLDNFVYQPI